MVYTRHLRMLLTRCKFLNSLYLSCQFRTPFSEFALPSRLAWLSASVTHIHGGWVPCHHGMARPRVEDGGKSSGYGG
jgi:hypothetical protein